ncbi:MAG TPA: iron-containing redox enzyme family protein [Nocardioidaceae bacterium]|nr:iron-containing redox enzyme family protein [Nocardioidaceae bacterium]
MRDSSGGYVQCILTNEGENMQLPRPRGPLSEQLVRAMREQGEVPAASVCGGEDDLQLSLWMLYEQHYRGFEDVDPRREWDPHLIAVRLDLETVFEERLRRLAKPVLDALDGDDLVTDLTTLANGDHGPSLASFLHREASLEQFQEFLVHRSLYHLKESDPHAFAIPRLDGPPKVALAELQYDEFGSGRPDALHSTLFADALEGAGLDRTYGAYVDVVPAYTLAVNNAMSLFGLHRRLRAACMGHLAAFEMTSSLPCRRYAQGADRLGMDTRVFRYFDEHIEADAVHEQIAARDICAGLVAQDQTLRDDVLLGAATCVLLDAVVGKEMLSAWQSGGSTLVDATHLEVA